jgi:hypothetical protein
VLSGYRHATLLAALVLLLLVRPFLGERLLGLALVDLLLMLTLVSSVLACAANRRQAAIGLVLAALMVLASWADLISEDAALLSVFPGLGLVFFGYVTFLMLRTVFLSTRRVSADTICGALSVYLLLGLVWTFAYALLELAQPGSFTLGGPGSSPDAQHFERFMGFSFVTLTTLGYGNIVPTSPRADALATMEAIVGQIYLTVLVARLVALQLTQAGARRSGSDSEGAGEDR